MHLWDRGSDGPPGENRLIPIVEQFDHRTRRALYAAADGEALRRRSWNGCALDRAAIAIGRSAKSEARAAEVFRLPLPLVTEFVRTWDGLRGTDEACTTLLRDAILAVGLFPRVEHAPDTVSMRAHSFS